MTSLYKACKAIVLASIDHSYLEECGENLEGVFMSEYGSWRKGGINPANCRDYLQGLPSACTVPFYNHSILKVLEALDVRIPKTEKGIYTLLENYWEQCGRSMACLLLFPSKYGVDESFYQSTLEALKIDKDIVSNA